MSKKGKKKNRTLDIIILMMQMIHSSPISGS